MTEILKLVFKCFNFLKEYFLIDILEHLIIHINIIYIL